MDEDTERRLSTDVALIRSNIEVTNDILRQMNTQLMEVAGRLEQIVKLGPDAWKIPPGS